VQIGRKPFTKEESWTRLLRCVGRFEKVPAGQVLGGANLNSVPRGARRRGKQDAEPWLIGRPIASKKQSLAESPGRKENFTGQPGSSWREKKTNGHPIHFTQVTTRPCALGPRLTQSGAAAGAEPE
jgi:hypothetical protein